MQRRCVSAGLGGIARLTTRGASRQLDSLTGRTATCRSTWLRKNIMATTNQTARLEARLPASVYATLKRAAELKGRSITDFVVSAAHDAALRAIEEEGILRLSAEDQLRFAQALLNPPAANAALKRAKKLHAKNVEVR